MWVYDHVDIGDSIICPHCGGEVGLDSWVLWDFHFCPLCLEVVTFEELSDAIDRAALYWTRDMDVSENIMATEVDARRLLGNQYERRKAGRWLS